MLANKVMSNNLAPKDPAQPHGECSSLSLLKLLGNAEVDKFQVSCAGRHLFHVAKLRETRLEKEITAAVSLSRFPGKKASAQNV